jgi:hypothetical protein
MKTKINLHGMTGLGDSLHQRAIVKYLLKNNKVQLETPWPQIYYDLYPHGLTCSPLIPDESLFKNFRTSKINMRRSDFWYGEKTDHGIDKHIFYEPRSIRSTGSFLKAMLKELGIPESETDFRMNIPESWCDCVRKMIQTKKPILFYKPITERKEWKYSKQRNPDEVAYKKIANYIISNNDFFTVSLCSLKENEEWIVGDQIKCDIKLHNGELNIKELCGLMKISSLCLTPPGFSIPMAQSIGTSSVCVFGGREKSSNYSPGSAFTSTLGIDTIEPCECFDLSHSCNKEIDIESSLEKISNFINTIQELR